MASHPLDVIARSPMRFQQYLLVALCCLINMTEGFDMLSLAYAAPVLSKEWGTPPALLGLTFSAASVGLALGSFALAPLADRWGRRPLMLGALVAITVSHACTSLTHSIYSLIALRLLMGLGLGILVVNLNVLVSEYSNDKRRNVLLASLHAGFTIGMMVSGLVSALLLRPFGWRAIFVAGAGMNVALLLLLFFFLRESPSFLISRQPHRALERLNRILRALGHSTLDSLPPRPPAAKKGAIFEAFFSPSRRTANLLIWAASLAFAVVGYFLLNWKPQVLVDAGLTATQASWGGVVQSAIGMLGHFTIGVMTKPGTERRTTALFFACMSVALVLFGTIHGGAVVMIGMGAILEFFTVGAYTGIFLVALAMYRPEIRTLGVGFVVGAGRVGAIIGPSIGGLLLGAGFGRGGTFAVFASISLLPIVTMILLSRVSRPGSGSGGTPVAAAA